MILLLMTVDQADTAVDRHGRPILLHVCYLAGSVDSTGRETGFTVFVVQYIRANSTWITFHATA